MKIGRSESVAFVLRELKKEKTEGEKKGEVERHGCSFKHNSITVGGCCEEEPLEV